MVLMPKKKQKQRQTESDATYFLKLVLYAVIGSLWIKFADPLVVGSIIISGIPLGLILGLTFASHDHFQVDRKIEYALLLVVTIVTFFIPAGIVI